MSEKEIKWKAEADKYIDGMFGSNDEDVMFLHGYIMACHARDQEINELVEQISQLKGQGLLYTISAQFKEIVDEKTNLQQQITDMQLKQKEGLESLSFIYGQTDFTVSNDLELNVAFKAIKEALGAKE